MSLEYPWYSTLFGGYTFIESIFSGIAIAGIITGMKLRGGVTDPSLRKVLIDTATMMFGFSLLWAGLFYAQFLVIWYGNLPEEVGFLTRRSIHFPLKIAGYSIILLLFVLPFVILLSKEIKKNSKVVSLVGLSVLLGIFVERLFYLIPDLTLNPLIIVFEIVMVGVLFFRLIFPEVISIK